MLQVMLMRQAHSTSFFPGQHMKIGMQILYNVLYLDLRYEAIGPSELLGRMKNKHLSKKQDWFKIMPEYPESEFLSSISNMLPLFSQTFFNHSYQNQNYGAQWTYVPHLDCHCVLFQYLQHGKGSLN